MDRSFLSRQPVIEASRRLVCVRLATYEDSAEAQFLKGLVPTGSGELENTTFAILRPDGPTRLMRSARGIAELFDSADDFAAALNRAADRFPPKADPGQPALPEVTTVRLAVNVAAADNVPLVVIAAREPAGRRAAEAALGRLAWAPEFVGRFAYAAATGADDLRAIRGAGDGGILVVQPEKFGRSGAVLARCDADAGADALAATLREGGAKFKGEDKSFFNHVRQGHQKGIFWETKIPVTDPMELQAREHGRGGQ
jgi:hypothetical protein